VTFFRARCGAQQVVHAGHCIVFATKRLSIDAAGTESVSCGRLESD
jgi:hypothetical protein